MRTLDPCIRPADARTQQPCYAIIASSRRLPTLRILRHPNQSYVVTPFSFLVSLSEGICRLILCWATVTIALQLDLLPKLLRSLAGWSPLAWPPRAPDNAPFPFDDSLHALYRLLSFGQPLLPWLLWISAFVVASRQSSVAARQ